MSSFQAKLTKMSQCEIGIIPEQFSFLPLRFCEAIKKIIRSAQFFK